MKRFTPNETLFLLGALGLILAGCTRASSRLDREATRTAKDEFGRIWIQYKDSWFTQFDDELGEQGKLWLTNKTTGEIHEWTKAFLFLGQHRLIQARDVTFSPRASHLSDPDRLNGCEWDGEIIFEARAYRYYEDGGERWSKWISSIPVIDNPLLLDESPIKVGLTKRNGEWKFKRSGLIKGTGMGQLL